MLEPGIAARRAASATAVPPASTSGTGAPPSTDASSAVPSGPLIVARAVVHGPALDRDRVEHLLGDGGGVLVGAGRRDHDAHRQAERRASRSTCRTSRNATCHVLTTTGVAPDGRRTRTCVRDRLHVPDVGEHAGQLAADPHRERSGARDLQRAPLGLVDLEHRRRDARGGTRA